MGLFDRVLRDGISKGLQDAVGKAVESTVRPAVDKLAGQAVETVYGAASVKLSELKTAFGEADAAMAQAQEAAGEVSQEQWGQAFSFLEGMAGDMMKDMRVCPVCEEAVKGDVQFCPKCGAKLPEKTVMELSLCPKCGKQNTPGTDFCTACGAKLPGKEMQEEAQRTKDAAVLEKWAEKLPQFPLWDCGGKNFDLSELETGRFYFGAWFEGDSTAAEHSVQRYRARLKEAGFQTAGKYPSEDHLYKLVEGVCCHADTEHCFEGDSDTPGIYFLIGDEPTGGFHYVKPEPKKKSGGLLGSLFG